MVHSLIPEREQVRHWLARLLDLERCESGWDIRLWPIGRLYYCRDRSNVQPGVERRLGVYRIGRWEHAMVWWWVS
jgi:hypothetical protein